MHIHPTRRLRRLSLAVLAGAGLLIGATAPAATAAVPPFTGGPVRPHQEFGALVNGHSDSATISMACVGPVRPGQRSHPTGGQTLDVFRPEALKVTGYTGAAADRIVARFSDDPSVTVTFTRYRTKPLPTSLHLPCAGGGTVTFEPRPSSPSARPVVVHVSYVGQP